MPTTLPIPARQQHRRFATAPLTLVVILVVVLVVAAFVTRVTDPSMVDEAATVIAAP